MGTEVATPKALALAEMINNNRVIDKQMMDMVEKAIESGNCLFRS